MTRECVVCKELKEIDEKIEVDMLYGHKSGYFHLMSEGVVNYCPTCGRPLSRKRGRRVNKWIAEFELEDGDTMPEHMDLEYKGARIDFHCKPLEQGPFINKPCVSEKVCEHDKQMVLDKIRAEIDGIEINGQVDEHTSFIRTGEQVKQLALNIIDKYNAENESQESEGKECK